MPRSSDPVPANPPASPKGKSWWIILVSVLVVLIVVGTLWFVRSADVLRKDLVELIKATAWPLAVLITFLVFRRPLSAFLEALAPRVTKISAFKVELELKAASNLSHPPKAVLAEVSNNLMAPVGDSAVQLLAAFKDPTPSDFTVIDLEDGDAWLTTRVFILAAQLERFRGLRCIVFLQTVDHMSGRLVGVATPQAVRWAFAMKWPYLEEEYARAYSEILTERRAKVISDRGALEPEVTQAIFMRFLNGNPHRNPATEALTFIGNQPPGPNEEWVSLGKSDPNQPASETWERAQSLDGRSLQDILGHRLSRACVIDTLDATPEKMVQSILRQNAPFVAKLRQDFSFDTIVDRFALATRLADASGQGG
jgi:hypothetical protein